MDSKIFKAIENGDLRKLNDLIHSRFPLINCPQCGEAFTPRNDEQEECLSCEKERDVGCEIDRDRES